MTNSLLVSFLSSVSKWHPTGIPLSVISEITTASHNNQNEIVEHAKQIVFCLPANASVAEIELVRGAAEKGLKLQKPSYEIMQGAQNLDELSGHMVVVCMYSEKRGVEKGTAKPIVYTHQAKDILAEVQKKKDFWEDLKKIAPLLG